MPPVVNNLPLILFSVGIRFAFGTHLSERSKTAICIIGYMQPSLGPPLSVEFSMPVKQGVRYLFVIAHVHYSFTTKIA